MSPFFVVIILAVFAAIAVYAYVSSRRRKKELAALAAAWGFTWDDDDPFDIEHRYDSFAALARGHSRHAYNVFHGRREGFDVICFDYRYRTGSGKHQSTHHLSGALLRFGYSFPYLRIRPEGLFDRVAEFVGFDDIDFESAEFSRAFYVKSSDRRFAFDVFHPKAMEYMLARPRRFAMEFRGDTMLVADDTTWEPGEFEAAIAQAGGLLELMPEYLRRGLKEGTL
jgi:hypothetical protein